MHGCVNARWTQGIPHSSLNLPPTVAFGVYPDAVIDASRARVELLPDAAANAAECQARVRREHPDANAAHYSNIGNVWCKAVYNATGVIFDAEVQTCLFSDVDLHQGSGPAVSRALDPVAFLRLQN